MEALENNDAGDAFECRQNDPVCRSFQDEGESCDERGESYSKECSKSIQGTERNGKEAAGKIAVSGKRACKGITNPS